MASSEAVRKIKVYTKTGDKGTSSLFNGTRQAKSDPVFEALGDTDELNAALGVAREQLLFPTPPTTPDALAALPERLAVVQSRLLDMGSVIATPSSTSTPAQLARVTFDAAHTDVLETWIDDMDAHLPPLRNFILPGGGLASAQLHVARATCRRAERRVVALADASDAATEARRFLNRLSDFLFVAARLAAQASGAPEAVYKQGVGVAASTAAIKATRAAQRAGASASAATAGDSAEE